MSDSEQEKIEKMKIKVEAFFKESFCADSAKVVFPFDPSKFKVACVVEVDTNDRGIFFIGLIEKL